LTVVPTSVLLYAHWAEVFFEKKSENNIAIRGKNFFISDNIYQATK